MVVVDAGLVPGGRSGRSDAAYQPRLGENGESVEDRLTRDRSEVALDGLEELVGRSVRTGFDCTEEGEPLRGDVEPPFPQLHADVSGHLTNVHLILDLVQILIWSTIGVLRVQ